jgi:hypothetical protein
MELDSALAEIKGYGADGLFSESGSKRKQVIGSL